jgi:uncharacterized protein YndB with AHSA1/START domain
MLKLKAGGFQFIQQAVISAPAKKVWKTVLNPNSWFGFGERDMWSKQTVEAWVGGRWHAEGKTGNTSLFGLVTLIEPGKLLRVSGPIGLSHLPVSNVLIFELTEQKDGKETLLKVCMRSSGFMDAGVKERYVGAWKHLLPQLKSAAEGK